MSGKGRFTAVPFPWDQEQMKEDAFLYGRELARASGITDLARGRPSRHRCAYCGRERRDTADSCPSCGAHLLEGE